MRVVIDTSALVSLGHTDLADKILDIYDVVISNGVLNELEEISESRDEDAKAAKKWLVI